MSPRRPARTLSSLVTLYAGGGMAVLALLVGLVFFQVVSVVQTEATRGHADRLARQLAAMTLDAVMVHDYATLERMVRDIVDDPMIPGVVIEAEGGEVLAEAGDVGLGALRTTAPVGLFGRDFGRVTLSHERPTLREGLQSALLAGVAGVLLLSAGLFYLLRHLFWNHLIAPVRRLLTAMDPRYPGPAESSDETVVLPREIADIQSHMAAMAGEVREQLVALHAANERTRQATARACREQRLAAIGQLAAGLAHGLNTPLGNVIGYAQMAREQDEEAKDEALTVIERQARLCSGVVANLMTMAHPEGGRETIEPDRWLDGVIRLLAPMVRQQGAEALRLEAEEAPASVVVDTVSLEHILFNLVSNAVQAGARRIVVRAEEDGVAGWQLTVADDGPGIPEALQSRLFEPFTTTKRAGEGTGLGLYVCRNLAETMGGGMEMESPPAGGSRFRLHLPRMAPGEEEPKGGEGHEPSPVDRRG